MSRKNTIFMFLLAVAVLMSLTVGIVSTHEPVSAFAINRNSRIDFADIVKLFGEI